MSHSIFACPLCRQSLECEEKTYRCLNGHSYDISAQGYVHLLPPNKMHSKIPGDNQQMVQSRREFLQSGFYSPFSEKLNQLVLEAISGTKSPVLLDVGCGEGYYTANMVEFLLESGISVQMAGFDISKFAIKAAAKKYGGSSSLKIEFAVGSAFGIPVADSSIDCLTNVFAPIVPEELVRIIKSGGTMILAVPGKRHLFGLKELLYEKPYENEEKETNYSGFTFIKRVPVYRTLIIEDNPMIQNLFAMTPYYWKTPVEGSMRLKQTAILKTEIEFDFIIYRRQ